MNKMELKQQIDTVRDRLNRIRKDIRCPLEADSSEQAVQLEDRDVLMELERVEAKKLADLERELARAL